MGPTLNNLHNLIRLPFGCGEQNMIHFAPNVYIMRYLQRTNQFEPEIKNEATGYLIQGKFVVSEIFVRYEKMKDRRAERKGIDKKTGILLL